MRYREIEIERWCLTKHQRALLSGGGWEEHAQQVGQARARESERIRVTAGGRCRGRMPCRKMRGT